MSAVTFETIHSNPDRARHLARSLGSVTSTVIADPFKASHDAGSAWPAFEIGGDGTRGC